MADDNDYESEDDFVPGADDEEDDEDFEADEEEVGPLLEGKLSIDETKMMSYVGKNFSLQATEPLPVNILDPTQTLTAAEPLIVTMSGICEIEDRVGKPAPRTFKVTISIPRKEDELIVGKSEGDDNEKAPAKKSSIVYHVSAKENATDGAECVEFKGGFQPGSDKTQAQLVCEARMFSSKPAVAAGAAVAAAAKASNPDDEDEDEDADEGVEMDELIALHEDAGLSVEDLRKRYHGGDSEQGVSKKMKATVEDDDEDDSDYGF